MLINFSLAALALSGSVLPYASPFQEKPGLDLPFLIEPKPVLLSPSIKLATNNISEPKLVCKSCSPAEQRTISFLQDNGIKDRNAVATILGNIRQESGFRTQVCEGGALTGYAGCSRGGFGALQWTDAARFHGLGRHARRIGGDPNTLETQLSYLVSEPDWKMVSDRMKTPGKSIGRYMNYASRWIRWGHHGARTEYAYDYARKIQISGVAQ